MEAIELIKRDLRRRMERDVRINTLPFWIHHSIDREQGGIYGLVTTDLRVHADAPKAVVICARVLWTYSAAYRLFHKKEYLEMADWAYDYLTTRFWDAQYSGVYFMLDSKGKPLNDRKQIYGEAFALYGLSEYYRATQKPESLERALELYRMIEGHSYDTDQKGYFEAFARDWQPLTDMRLSEIDLNAPKSMNTMLHIMEAYANLMRVWDDADLRRKQKELMEVLLERVISPVPYHHFTLFFDAGWKQLSNHISFGHDIEGSWLMLDSVRLLGDAALTKRVEKISIQLAQAVYDHGLDRDGSLFNDADPEHVLDTDKHWWPQAEAVVGFYNAYQLTGREHFFEAARRCWEYIEDRFIDRTHGEWYAKLTQNGELYPDYPADRDQCKVGPWKCPYHNSRACFEMIDRLA